MPPAVVKNKAAAVVPAAGSGTRFIPGKSKTFFQLLGKPVVIWAIEALSCIEWITEIVPVFKQEEIEFAQELIEKYSLPKVRKIAPGGAERQDSVLSGLRCLPPDTEIVLIHDGARPLLDTSVIERTLQALTGFDGSVASVPIKDTVKEAREDGEITMTLKRSTLWAAQTPQMFFYPRLIEAYEKASSEGLHCTDDSALIEKYGGRVSVAMGSYQNIKVTTPEDLAIAEAFLKARGDK